MPACLWFWPGHYIVLPFGSSQRVCYRNVKKGFSENGSLAPEKVLALLAKIHSGCRFLPPKFLWREGVGTSSTLTSSFEHSDTWESGKGHWLIAPVWLFNPVLHTPGLAFEGNR